MIKIIIGEKIRTIRTAKGYSQDYVVNLLNIKQPAYSDIETDKTKLNLERAQEIANILEIDVAELLPFDSNQIFNNTFNQDAKGFFNVKKFLTKVSKKKDNPITNK